MDSPTGSAGADTLNERFAALEAAEAQREDVKRLDRKLELVEAILLSLAAVLAAWAGFQAAKWSGVQTDSYSEAGSSRVESNLLATIAGEQVILDAVEYLQWLEALQAENLLDAPTARNPESLSTLIYNGFRPEFMAAVDAWLEAEPFSDPDAPAAPFLMPEYSVEEADRAAELQQKAEGQAAFARTANQHADNDVVMTILLASVLLFVGIAPKMHSIRARGMLLVVGGVLFISSLTIALTLPKEI